MAISRLVPTSFSTEGIATVKITGTATITAFTVPLPAGTYKISSGYSGSIAITLYDASDNPLNYFTFATQGMFTINQTAAKVGIVAASAAINGIVDFNILQRGKDATALGLTLWNTKALANVDATAFASMQVVNGYLYVIGGHNGVEWNTTTGNAVIQRWDMNPANSFSVVYNPGNTSINGANSSVVSGNYIYFTRGNAAPSALLRFDTTNNTITTLTNRPVGQTLGSILINNAGTKIYSFGSYQNGAARSFVYDIATNAWTEIAGLPQTSDGWGGNQFRNPNNSDQINIIGMSGQTPRYRYNIAANTYTNLGGENISFYTNQGSITPNNNYYITTRTLAGTPQSQFSAWKTDGSEDTQYVYTPTAAALVRDSIISATQETNGGNSIAINSTYVFARTKAQTAVYYTPTTAFLGALN